MLRIIARVSLGLVLLVPPDEAAAPRLIDPENSGASNTVFTIDSARTEDSAGAKKTFVGGLFSIRAFAYPSWWRGNYASAESERQLDALKATGANAVSIIPTVYVSSGSAHDFRATNNTESDANVIHAIQDAHARGLDVMLKPHIDSVDGTWRAQFNPADPKAWFAGYKALIVKYAQIAADTRVSMLSVGCEFTKLTGPQHRADWLDLIAAVRAVYKGPLTYAASWGEEAKSLAFWDTLDVIGVDHYANLTASAAPSVGQLVDAWTTAPLAAYGKPPILFYRDLAAAHGKPLLFTEIGYRSLDGANREPWNFWTGGRADPQEQADAYTAFFQVASQYGGNWLMGAHLWNWEPLTSGNTPTGFTPQGKPAEAVIHDWFSGSNGGSRDPRRPPIGHDIPW